MTPPPGTPTSPAVAAPSGPIASPFFPGTVAPAAGPVPVTGYDPDDGFAFRSADGNYKLRIGFQGGYRVQPTIRDVMMQMIITSDNTATDLAIAKVGGVAAVNTWLQANSFAPALKLNTTVFEVFRNRYVLADPGAATLTPEDVYALGSGDFAYGTSPRSRLEAIQSGMQKAEVQKENLRRLNDELGKTIIMVTHDPHAAQRAHSIKRLDKGVLQDGER